MRRMKWALAIGLAVVLVLAMVVPLAAAGLAAGKAGVPSDGSVSRPTQDKTSALVQLKGDPLATYAKTKPPQGKKIDFSSNAVKSYRARLSAQRNEFKRWLRTNAPKARVTGEYDIALNAVAVQLNGTKLDTLKAAPMVQRAEYQGLYYPVQAAPDPDLDIINAVEAWAQDGGPADAGEGVKVAVIDSGIDASHPCFDDSGYPNVDEMGDTRFTNNKVIAAKVFNNKAGSRGYTPEAINDHGTHVAGTIACNYQTPAVVDGVDIPYDVSGVAPRALLGNYNVFPKDVANARSEDIMNALEAAYLDDFDVANMSLGGGSHGIQDLLSMAVDALDEAGMVIAVAAGNSGPGHFTVESPGIAPRALTAGASTVPHFVGAPVSVGGNTYGAAAGDFEVVSSDLTAPLGVVVSGSSLSTACSALPADSLTGKIALVSRGTCSFSTKIRNAQNAGAVATLVVNNVAGDPTAMAQDGTPNQPTIPAYMVALAAKGDLMDADGEDATIDADLAYFLTDNENIMAGFSGQGPTDVDFRVKPDVVAPGVNVLSSIPLSFCGEEATTCWAFFQGTSMATPHLAGSAAVVIQQQPDWSPAQVRSAIVNTAQRGVLTDFQTGGTVVADPNIIGAGLEDLEAAVQAQVTLDPVSVSFGAIPSGAGQTQYVDITLTNVSGTNLSVALSVTDAPDGVSYTVDTAPFDLGAGESATVKVEMIADKGIPNGDYAAWLMVEAGGTEVAHAAIYTLVK